MDPSFLDCRSVLRNFLFFLPFFFGLFLLGTIKGFVVLPFSIAILSIGNSVVLLGLWPAQVIGTYYAIARTKKLGPVLKVVLGLLLPIPFFLLLVFGITGSVLVGSGYGFFTPLVATFEAVREGRQNKLYHCFLDGVWDTIKGSCTVVRDFTDFCYHSYFSSLKDFCKDPSPDSQAYEIKVLDLPGCVLVGVLGVLVDVPFITSIAVAKSPYMLLRGWRRLLQDLVGREGPFLETVCVPVAGLAVLMWPLIVAVAVVCAIFSSVFIGLYGAVVVYEESSFKCGLAYIVAVIAQFDEYTNDLIYMREGSCLPRPHYRKNIAQSTESFATRPPPWVWHGEPMPSPARTPKSSASIGSRTESEASSIQSGTYTKSLKQTLQEVKMVQIWDNIFKTCEQNGKVLLQEDAIKILDLEEWLKSSNSAKARTIAVGLPAFALLTNLIRSGKAGVSGLLLVDDVEVTMDNRPQDPQDRMLDWFFEPLLVLKEQIRAAKLKESEELYLLKWVLTSGDPDKMIAWQNGGLQPEDEVRKGEIQAWSRRVQGIATSVSRLPTFRRRYQSVVKSLISLAYDGNLHSPMGRTKGSPSETSLSSTASFRHTKANAARFSEVTSQKGISPGKTTGGNWKGYSTLDGDERV